tara:strand:- start:563 stop:751 length:189 start_codon:yes stop_codon:yes gene_type:complete
MNNTKKTKQQIKTKTFSINNNSLYNDYVDNLSGYGQFVDININNKSTKKIIIKSKKVNSRVE